MTMHNYIYGAPHPIFRVFSRPSGVDNLPAAITLNSTTKTPIGRYNGLDADGVDWPHWGYGEVLDYVADGAAPTYNTGSPCLGVNDDSVKFNAGSFYRADNNSFGDVGTDDILIEIIFRYALDGLVWVDKQVGVSDNGWRIFDYATSDKMRFVGKDALANSKTCYTAPLIGNTWYHGILAINRNEAVAAESAQWYINGVASGNGASFSAVGDLDSDIALAIGAQSGGSLNCYGGTIAYFAIYRHAGWLQDGAAGQAEVAVLAAQRFAEVAGYYPQVAFGTAMPTEKTRAFEAYVDKMVGSYRKLYYVGGEWLRMCSREDLGSVEVQGYLPEPEVQNLIVESEDCGTTWAKITGTDTIDTDGAVCADGRSVADGIIGDANNVQHGFSIASTLTAVDHAFSVFSSPGDKDWIKLEDSTVANCWCYFDVANGAVGTSGAGAVGYIEGPFSGDAGTTVEYRCCIIFTGTVAAHTLEMMAAVDDNDDDFSGDASTPNVYFWGMQCEIGDYMTSPIVTIGGTATRLADQLTYAAGDNIGGEDIGHGSILCNTLIPASITSINRHPYRISDGDAAADQIYPRVRSGAAGLRGVMAATGGNDGQVDIAVDAADGYKHKIRLNWETDNFVGYIDSSSDVDNTADTPDDLDIIDIGHNSDGGYLKGLISDFRIYPEPTTEE